MAAPKELAEEIRARAAALERFARWKAAHPSQLSIGAGLEAVGALFELLPQSSRRRAVDPNGVMALHTTLQRLVR